MKTDQTMTIQCEDQELTELFFADHVNQHFSVDTEEAKIVTDCDCDICQWYLEWLAYLYGGTNEEVE